MTKDSEGFSAEMAKTGVKPLAKRQEKVLLHSPRQNLNTPGLRQAAASDFPQQNDPHHYEGVEWLGPHDIVEYKQQGIQHAVFKSLKQGRYEIGADLDLHSYRVEEAKIVLFQFVKDCIEQDLRCAIVVHGKGWHGQSKGDSLEEDKGKLSSRIKSYTVHWLKSMSVVQAFSSAQARDGGTGALYVLFKKSERAKQENRRHFYPDEK